VFWGPSVSRVESFWSMGPNTKPLGMGTCWGPSSSEGPQKHNLTMLSKYGLWTGIFGFMIKAYTMRSMIVTKLAVAPKLCTRKLWLNRRKGNRLKRERLFNPYRFFYKPIVNVKGMIVISHRLCPVLINR
jgi:hypothetical protein